MPRSPSRDLSDRFTGNRAYFHRSERLRRNRFMLAAVAVVFVACWAVADVAAPARMAYTHTHGPVANPHAAWDNDCASCHKGHSLSDFGVLSVLNARDRWHDLTCEKCHAGPAHNQKLTGTGRAFHDRCSNCHHDHNGRLNSLVRIADSHCTSCHANLNAHHVTGAAKGAAKVTNFATDHPEFRPLTTQPERSLKFSHALHMNPGMARASGDRAAATVADVAKWSSPATAERFRKPGQADADLVSLDCASCHKLDSGAGTPDYDRLKAALDARGEPTRSILPDRAGGSHFLPVNFELHCRSCHPLRAGEQADGARLVSGFDVPHRQQAAELKEFVTAAYVRKMIADDSPLLAQPVGPGGRGEPRPGAGPAAKTILGEARGFTERVMPSLTTGSGGCAKCHDMPDSKVKPIPDRTVWLPAAKFDHAVHRVASCATCHPGTGATFAPPGTALVEKEPAQILGVESCRACHSPAGTKVTLPDKTTLTGGGTRHDCVDCHRYHNADHGRQGRGADVLRPARPLELADFLRGKRD